MRWVGLQFTNGSRDVHVFLTVHATSIAFVYNTLLPEEAFTVPHLNAVAAIAYGEGAGQDEDPG